MIARPSCFILLTKHGLRAMYMVVWAAGMVAIAMPGTEARAQVTAPPPATTAPPAPITVTPRDLLPRSTRPRDMMALPQAGSLQAPAGAEQLPLSVGAFVLDGGFADMARATAAITAPLTGHAITLADLYAAASAIEAAYARRGYVLVRLSVPPQDITPGGAVRLTVTDGFVEEIDLAGVPTPVRQAVAAALRPLQARQHIRLGQIERALLLAGEVPGLALRSTLATGVRAGGTRLIVEGQFRRAGLTLSARNDFAPSLGTWGHSEQAVLNAPFERGEAVYVFVSGDRDIAHLFGRTARVRVAGGGAIWRAARGAITINPEVTFSRTRPDPLPGAPATVGVLKRYALRTGYAITRRRTRSLTATLAAEATDVVNKAPDFAVLLSRDRYAALRFGLQASRDRDHGGTVTLLLQASQGLGPLGGRSASTGGFGEDAVPLSRSGAGFGFTRIEGNVAATIPIGPRGQLSLHLRGQSTLGKPVLRTEQFSLEGDGAITAYVGGISAVDEGGVARAELATTRQIALPGRQALTLAPYLFGAAGLGRIDRPTAAEPGQLQVAAFGAGARTQLGRNGPTLSAEWAEAISDFAPLDKVHRITVSLGFSI